MQKDPNPAALQAIKVVAMGGGTGLSTLLHGLKRYVAAAGETPLPGVLSRIEDLSAIVTVSDDGGSSGLFFNDTAATEIYTLSYTMLFRAALSPDRPASSAG